MNLTSVRAFGSLRSDPRGILISLIFFATLLRFAGLDQAPQGFYVDEAAIAAQVICLSQSGGDLNGAEWPLFSQVLGGGYATPAMLYLGSAWTFLFGDSIASFRSFAAFHGALTVAGVFALALALWRRRDWAWLAALCCALSPWGFQFSRIAWDPALAPAYLVWGLALILAEGRWARVRALGGGFLLALACYSYPPTRMQAVLFLPAVALVGFFAHPRRRQAYLIAVVSFLLAMIPLVWLTLSGELQGRFNMLSIAGDYYLQHVRGQQGQVSSGAGSSFLIITQAFIENMALNLSPEYLFVSGDRNLRHSTQVVGQWSWTEIAAFVFLVAALLMRLWRSVFVRRSERVVFALLVWGYISGVIPAAMTWESNPHALRSIGAYPFLALMAGFLLGRASEWRPQVKWWVLALSIAFAAWYFTDYFRSYPDRSELWFDTAVVEAAQGPRAHVSGPSLEELKSRFPQYPELALHYYELSSGRFRCGSADHANHRPSAYPNHSQARRRLKKQNPHPKMWVLAKPALDRADSVLKPASRPRINVSSIGSERGRLLYRTSYAQPYEGRE